ncbi:hypothetical protein AM10699_62650 (plasmid) [Acaryochloris marina MBIC10699]|nr:hypothetical protein AM10699_62650 [Acaryochloris marina MBIC10699]
MESELFCLFWRWGTFRGFKRIHPESRKAVLEGRGFYPSFLVKSAETTDLVNGYGSFRNEVLKLNPSYQPEIVTLDG